MSMPTDTFSVLITGIGGQGVLSAAKAVAYAAHCQYPFVHRTEERGLSQRGGACSSCIRFGTRQIAPTAKAKFDLIIGLEEIEAARAVRNLSAHGTLLLAENMVLPAYLQNACQNSASSMHQLAELRAQICAVLNARKLVRINLMELAQVDRKRVEPLNAFMLGAAQNHLPLTGNVLLEGLLSLTGSIHQTANQEAFAAGFAAVQQRALRAAS